MKINKKSLQKNLRRKYVRESLKYPCYISWCGRQNETHPSDTLPKLFNSLSPELVNTNLHGKRGFAEMMKLGSLRWG